MVYSIPTTYTVGSSLGSPARWRPRNVQAVSQQCQSSTSKTMMYTKGLKWMFMACGISGGYLATSIRLTNQLVTTHQSCRHARPEPIKEVTVVWREFLPFGVS